MSDQFNRAVDFIRSLYPNENPVPLHAPRFFGNEKKYLGECIDSTFVSYVGKFVTDFEDHIKRLTGAKHAVAMVNGTASLQIALIVGGVKPGEEVLTQALTFVATPNAIKHAGAEPVFLDVDKDSLGLSPMGLEDFLKSFSEIKSSGCFNKKTGKKISACVPMHTFGHPVRIDDIMLICEKYLIPVIEDAAESLGSYHNNKHTGTSGCAGILSFNGNKTITTGGGGMIITDSEEIANHARHLSTTAKRKHPWEFFHDEVGYNLRMPNVNAAVGCAQMEKIDIMLQSKRDLAMKYKAFFENSGMIFVEERQNTKCNYWLNAILLNDRKNRDEFLKYSNGCGIQTRPAWTLMNKLPMFKDCMHGDLSNAEWIEDRLVNIPSSVRI